MLHAAIAETRTLEKGLALVEQMGCSPIIIETDSMEPVQLCNGMSKVLIPYVAIMAECFVFAPRLGNISIQHYPRDVNKVAHGLIL